MLTVWGQWDGCVNREVNGMGVLTVWGQWDGCVNSVGSMGWVC